MRPRAITTARFVAALFAFCMEFGVASATRGDDSAVGPITEYQATPRQLISLLYEPRAAAASPDGRLLATGDDDGLIVLWSTETGLPVRSLVGHTKTVAALAFDRSGSRIASAAYDAKIHIWNVADGSVVDVLTGHAGRLATVAFSPDGRRLASGGYDKTIRLWDLDDGGSETSVLADFDAAVRAVAFSPDGARLASCDSAGALRVYSLANLSDPPVVVDGSGVCSLRFSPDGGFLLTGTDEGQVVKWDCETLERTGQITERDPRPLHAAPVTGLAFSPNGRLLATADQEGLAQVWDLEWETVTSVLGGHEDEIAAVAFLAGGESVLTVGVDRTVNTWRSKLPLTAGVGAIEDVDARLWALAVSPEGTLFAGGRRSFLASWDLETGRRLMASDSFDGTIDALALTADGGYLACCGWKHETVVVVDATTGEAAARFEAGVRVRCVRFSPDGQTLVAGCEDGALRIWSWRTDDGPRTVPTGSLAVYDVAFSPDGSQLVSCSGDWRNPEPGEVVCWNTGDWSELRRLAGHSHAVRSLAFSGDGRLVASAAEDGRVIVTNAETYVTVAEYQNAEGTRPIAMSPDGTHLAVGLHDGTINVWDTERGEVVQRFQSEDDVFGVSYSSDGTVIFSVSGEERVEAWPAMGIPVEESAMVETIRQWSMQRLVE